MLIDLKLLGFSWPTSGTKIRKWGLPVGYYPHSAEKIARLHNHGFATTQLQVFRVVNVLDLTVPVRRLDAPEKLLFATLSRVNLLSKNHVRARWTLIGSIEGLSNESENGWAVRVHEIQQTPEVALQLIGLAHAS